MRLFRSASLAVECEESVLGNSRTFGDRIFYHPRRAARLGTPARMSGFRGFEDVG